MLPNFLVIGAARSGTTSLYRMLAQHPDIFLSPRKEPSFFAYEGHPLDFCGPRDRELGAPAYAITRREDYEALFAGWKGQRAIGEASPFYLCVEGTAERIARLLPEVKLIAVLRDPAARAFSQYAMFVRDGRERLGFRRALAQCEARRRANWAQGWQYIELGFYARQLQRYYAHFARQQIKILFYDDLCRDPAGFFRDVLEFLDVDPSVTVDVGMRHNASRLKRRWLHRLLYRPNPLRTAARRLLPDPLRSRVRDRLERHAYYRLQLAAADRAMLVDIYRDDILALQDMTGRDLSAWLR